MLLVRLPGLFVLDLIPEDIVRNLTVLILVGLFFLMGVRLECWALLLFNLYGPIRQRLLAIVLDNTT